MSDQHNFPQGQGQPYGQQPNGASPAQGGYAPQYQQPQPEPKKKRGRGCLWMILGAILLLVLLIVGAMALFGTAANKVNNDMKAKHTVTYKVTGNSAADVTYTNDTNGSTSQASDVKLPWSKTVDLKGLTSGMNITVQNKGAGTVACEVDVDGKAVKSISVEGQNSSASCVAP